MSIEPRAEFWQEISKTYAVDAGQVDLDLADDLVRVLREAGLTPPRTLLEVGCGSGHLSLRLQQAGYATDLLDFSENALDKAGAAYREALGEGHGSRFVLGDLLQLEAVLGERRYDVVWNSGVLEHFSRDRLQVALRQMARAAEQAVVFLVPNPDSLIYLAYRTRMLALQRWDVGVEFLRTDYEEVLAASGLRLERHGYCGLTYSRVQLVHTIHDPEQRHWFDAVLAGGQVPRQTLYLQYFVCTPTSRPSKLKLRAVDDTPLLERTFYLDALGTFNGVLARLRQELETGQGPAGAQAVRERDQALAVLRGQMDGLTAQITALSANAQTLSGLVAEKELRAQTLADALAAHQAAAALAAQSREAELQAARGQLAEQAQAAAVRAGELTGLRQQVAEREAQVAALGQRITALQQELASRVCPPGVEQTLAEVRRATSGAIRTLEEFKLHQSFRVARLLQLVKNDLLTGSLRHRMEFARRLLARAGGNRAPLSGFHALNIPIGQLRQVETLLGTCGAAPGTPTVAPGLPPLPARAARPNVVNIVTYLFYDLHGQELMGGGAERYLIELCRIIHDLGYQAEVYQCGRGAWCRTFEHARVFGLDVNGEYAALNQRFHEAIAPGALTIYSAFNVAQPYCHPHSLGISHGIFWDHAFYQNAAYLAGLRRAFDNCQHLVSVDTNTMNWVRATMCEYAARCTYIPNFVDPDEFCPRPTPRDDGRVVVLYPRRLYGPRGFWLVAERIPELIADFPQVEFHFVGKADEREERAVKELVARFPQHVRWYFCQPDHMCGAYQAADIALVPTVASEGTSLSCLEAMACGNTVVATNVGGLPELVTDGLNGLLIEPTAESLDRALRRLLKDPELRQRLSRNAVQAAQAYHKQIWVERWRGVLQRVLPAPTAETATATQPREFVHLCAGGQTWSYMRQRPQQLFLALAEAGQHVHYVSDEEIPARYELGGRLHIVGRSAPVAVSRPILYIYDTYQYQRLGEFTDPMVVYDVLDDPVIHAEADRQRGMPADGDFLYYHERLLREADVVITSSVRLHARYAAQRPDIVLVPNAVRPEDFRRATVERPGDLPAVGAVLVGYYGAIAEWFDLEMLAQAARERPEYHFILIGLTTRQAELDELEQRCPNVHYLGQKSYETLPAYLASFDVATIPFLVNEITNSVSPVKLFEYLAGGKPVVSTGFEEIRQYDEVLIAQDADDFVAKLDLALTLRTDASFLAQARRLVEKNTWAERAQRVLTALAQRAGGDAAAPRDGRPGAAVLAAAPGA